MILEKGEKILVIHRRLFDKDIRRHFIGVVEAYDSGVLRASGHVHVYDPVKARFVRKDDRRTRVISVVSGDVLVNVLPVEVKLDKISYESGHGSLRVSDGTGWRMDITEFGWLDSAYT